MVIGPAARQGRLWLAGLCKVIPESCCVVSPSSLFLYLDSCDFSTVSTSWQSNNPGDSQSFQARREETRERMCKMPAASCVLASRAGQPHSLQCFSVRAVTAIHPGSGQRVSLPCKSRSHLPVGAAVFGSHDAFLGCSPIISKPGRYLL